MTATACTMDDILTGPGAFTKWSDMNRAQRAHAVYLCLRRRWLDKIDIRRAATYDKHTGLVVVEWKPGGFATWSLCLREAVVTLEVIEDEFGADAREAAERVIDAPERR